MVPTSPVVSLDSRRTPAAPEPIDEIRKDLMDAKKLAEEVLGSTAPRHVLEVLRHVREARLSRAFPVSTLSLPAR